MKVALIRLNDKLVFVDYVRELDSAEFIQKRIEAKRNLEEIISEFKKLEKQVNVLTSKIELLEKEIKVLKGED